jgi:hypothetical protein
MRKLSVLRGGGEKVGVLAFEVAALMSRAAVLWRALGDAPLTRLRGEGIRLEGVRRLVADDDAALLALAVAEVGGACSGLARAVARLAARCADPLLRRFEPLFAALVAAPGGAAADRHGVRYAAGRKMDRKARKMQRLAAATAHLCHELDVLAELEQAARRGGGGREAARRVARQRLEVERLRAASLWNRTFDYAVRLLARSIFTIVARVVEVFGLELTSNASTSIHDSSSNSKVWSIMQSVSMVYPSDAAADETQTARQMLRTRSASGDARRFLMSRSKSLKQQLKWPAAGKRLIGCVVTGSKSPVREKRRVHGAGDLPLSVSYVSTAASRDDYSSGLQFQANHHRLSTSVFESSRDVLANAPEASLGGAALALHYANLIIFIERLAVAPHHICSDERDELYGMLTHRVRASLRTRLGPFAKTTPCDPILAAEWADTVRRVLAWLAPLAHNMLRWHAERSFEQRDVASSAGVLLLQTLHFADRGRTEAAVTELLVGLNYLWRSGKELEENAKLESAVTGNYEDCTA